MKAIVNVADGTMPNKYSPTLRQTGNRISLDYLKSDDLKTVEDGIKETMEGINYANLAVAIAFAKIDIEAMYVQAGCKSYLEYLDKAEDRLNMSRQSMSDYKRIGEIYLKYKSQLQQVGFREEGHLHKLRFLPRALEHHAPEVVFKRIVKDTLRRFMEFAGPSGDSQESQALEYNPDIEPAARKVVIDGQDILRFTPELKELTRNEITEYLEQIYAIKAKGNIPYVLDLYDQKEARAVDNFLKRHRMKK